MTLEPQSNEQQDAEWRQLRRANRRRLLMFPLLVALTAITCVVWWAASSDYSR